MSSSHRAEQLKSFNEKLESVKKSSTSVGQKPQHQQISHSSSLKAAYPDFDGMARTQKEQLELRRLDAEARSRIAVERSHIPKTAQEYRGQGAVPIRHATKNEATAPSQLSVPIADNKKPYYLEVIEQGKRVGKKTSDVCLAETDAVITGRGSLFAQQNCKTFKGWQPGCF